MSQHTPGPWRAARIRSPGRAAAAYYIYGAGKDQRSPCVAHVKNSTIQPLHANARLIAAAPDLLAAAKSAARLLWEIASEVEDGVRTLNEDSAEGKAWTALTNAIAKAEGQS